MYWTFANACTLVQATLLRQPSAKRWLNIPTPEVIAPPGCESPKPTLRESFRAVYDLAVDRYEKARLEADRRAQAQISNERARGLRAGTSRMLTERIQERRGPAASGAVPKEKFMEVPSHGRQKTGGTTGRSRNTPRKGTR